MKTMLYGCGTLLLALALPAYADHWRVGVMVGPVWGPPAYFPLPLMPPPPVEIVVPVAPSVPVYVEQTPASSQPSPVWYYCRKPKGYYPYIKQCPAGWQIVPQTPPADSGPVEP
jgi:hypothetical protein